MKEIKYQLNAKTKFVLKRFVNRSTHEPKHDRIKYERRDNRGSAK